MMTFSFLVGAETANRVLSFGCGYNVIRECTLSHLKSLKVVHPTRSMLHTVILVT